MKKVIVLFAALFVAVSLIAQTDSGSVAANTVAVKQDPRIGELLKKHAEANLALAKSMRRTAPGFRILVINTPSRDKAVEAKTKMYQEFPELKSYLLFQSPKFHLKVGNFLDRAEAEAYLESIRKSFTTGVYIVRDTIELQPGNKAETEQ